MNHRIEVQRVDGIADGFDFDAHYTVKGFRGVAFYALGWEAEYKPVMCYGTDDEGCEIEVESDESELVPNIGRVVLVMVGDDRRHVYDVEDCILLAEDAFCRECGQVGCGCSVMEAA